MLRAPVSVFAIRIPVGRRADPAGFIGDFADRSAPFPRDRQDAATFPAPGRDLPDGQALRETKFCAEQAPQWTIIGGDCTPAAVV